MAVVFMKGKSKNVSICWFAEKNHLAMTGKSLNQLGSYFLIEINKCVIVGF